MPFVQGVHFDGLEDNLERDADLTGAADTKTITGAGWILSNQTVSRLLIDDQGSTRFGLVLNTDHTLRILGRNTSSVNVLDIKTSANMRDGDWHHFMFSFDLTDTGKRHLYVDGVSDLVVTTYTNDLIDVTTGNFVVGDRGRLEADLADLEIDFSYVDLSIAANREAYYNNGPVDRSVAGPSSIVFLSGDVATWHTNDGTGGGFTSDGTLTAAATNPGNGLSGSAAQTFSSFSTAATGANESWFNASSATTSWANVSEQSTVWTKASDAQTSWTKQ